MLTAPMRGAAAPPDPGVAADDRRRRVERRQRRTVVALGVMLAGTAGSAIVTSTGGLWVAALVVAVISTGYLLAVVHVRRSTARREMAAAFASARSDWDTFGRALSDVGLSPHGATVEVPDAPPRRVLGFDRELALFVGAWALGLVLTPVVAVIRLAGHDLSDPDRRGILATLVRIQAYGRSQSLKVVAAGLFATAGVTAVGAAASGATAYASPAPVTSDGVRAAAPSAVSRGPMFIDLVRFRPAVSALGHRPVTAPKRHRAESVRAARATAVALAQVGEPYEYGAAGPGGFDCSGLVMYSWGAAGVPLPHNAAMQFSVTGHIAESQLRPGDLVFYYGFPPGHVAIYVGRGQVVSANTTGTNVQTQPITWDGAPTGFSRVG